MNLAVTGFWPIYKNLRATLDYADNPDKTTAPEYLDEDLYAALRYAENDDKTDRKMFTGGINCSAQNAYAEMIAVQRRFGLRGKVVGYHGIQSFREGEVTPEQAFEIGKATARKMWGDKYQVLVTVHLNTDNVHCHFVVNPVSFKDGTKFQNKIGDHKELRRVSDEICREHGLSVLENSSFYGGNKKDYWRHKSGKKTHRDYLREDVEYCLSFVERIYITDENDERHCHIFIKGCSKEDYDDFFRATGYIENTQETGAVTSVLPVCDSDECCKNYVIFAIPFRVC